MVKEKRGKRETGLLTPTGKGPKGGGEKRLRFSSRRKRKGGRGFQSVGTGLGVMT